MRGIVVEHHETIYFCSASESHCVFDTRVAPADMGAVLVNGILGVMEEHVCAFGYSVARDPVWLDLPQVDTEGGLVIGEVGKRSTVRRDAEPHCGPLVYDRMPRDEGRTDQP